MTVRNERFNRCLLPLDAFTDDELEKSALASDRGTSVEDLVRRLDSNAPWTAQTPERPEERWLLNDAMVLMFAIYLTALGYGHLVPTLWHIACNGSDSAASIRALRRQKVLKRKAAKRLYFRHREQLRKVLVSLSCPKYMGARVTARCRPDDPCQTQKKGKTHDPR